MNREVFLAKLIEDTGMNQKAFTEKIGIPYSALRSVLNNGVGGAGVDIVMKICDGLGIKVEDLKEHQEPLPKIEKPSLIKKMKHARIRAGLTKDDVCKKLGIPMSTFHAWDIGESQPDSETFIRLCKLYRINSFADILDNYCDETETTNLSELEKTHIKKYRAIDMRGRETVDLILNTEYKRYSKSKNTEFTFNDFNYLDEPRQLPVYTLPIDTENGTVWNSNNYKIVDVDDEIPVNANFGLKIIGDSMNPKLDDGDIVWVKRQDYLENEQIGIVSFNGRWFCRAYNIKNNTQYLITYNGKEKNIALKKGDKFKVVGRVIGVTSKEIEHF